MLMMAPRNFRIVREAILHSIFLVVFWRTVKTEESKCEYIVNSTQGVVTSPNYPQEHPDSIRCMWKIETRPGYIIKLAFDSFDLEENCTADNLEVYDWEAENEILLGSYCGKNLPPPMNSTSNKMFLILTTDASTQFSGFKATYFTEPKCLQVINLTEGTITNPFLLNDYPTSEECFYKFESTPEKRIKLTFDFSILGLDTLECDFDYIDLYDGEFVNSPYLGRFCDVENPFSLKSTTHNMLMVFHSSGSIISDFKVTYSTEPITILTSIQGVIITPNYPYEYSSFSDYVWKIEYKVGYIIKVEFNSFDVEPEMNCSADYVALYDGGSTSGTLLGKYCGFEIPPPVISTSHKMLIVFRSDDSKQYKGFNATYSTTFSMKSIVNHETERNLTQYLLNTRGLDARAINKWGFDITKIVVALFLHDPNFFAVGNQTREHVAHELMLQAVASARDIDIPEGKLALLINAFTVICINPRYFFNWNLVAELDKIEHNINPFAILTLCKAGEMTKADVISKLQQLFYSHFTTTDMQAFIVMALKCISNQLHGYLESDITDMLEVIKQKQQDNGAVENLKTTALVVQALIATNSIHTNFNLGMAIKFMLEDVRQGRVDIEGIYYFLPIFKWKTLLDINSDHCKQRIKTDLFITEYLLLHPNERIRLPISKISIVFEHTDWSQTWRLKMPTNFTFYQELSSSGSSNSRRRVRRHIMSGGDPYVDGFASYPENMVYQLRAFWFTYSIPLLTTEAPILATESPDYIPVKETNVLIIWYRK